MILDDTDDWKDAATTKSLRRASLLAWVLVVTGVPVVFVTLALCYNSRLVFGLPVSGGPVFISILIAILATIIGYLLLGVILLPICYIVWEDTERVWDIMRALFVLPGLLFKMHDDKKRENEYKAYLKERAKKEEEERIDAFLRQEGVL